MRNLQPSPDSERSGSDVGSAVPPADHLRVVRIQILETRAAGELDDVTDQVRLPTGLPVGPISRGGLRRSRGARGCCGGDEEASETLGESPTFQDVCVSCR